MSFPKWLVKIILIIYKFTLTATAGNISFKFIFGVKHWKTVVKIPTSYFWKTP